MLERHFDGLSAEEVDRELAAVPARGATPSSAAAAAYLASTAAPTSTKTATTQTRTTYTSGGP